MGASSSTAFGPAGLGDLYVTAAVRGAGIGHSERSLDQQSHDQSLEEMHMVAEGVRATRMFLNRAPKLGVGTPFIEALGELLDGGHHSRRGCEKNGGILNLFRIG